VGSTHARQEALPPAPLFSWALPTPGRRIFEKIPLHPKNFYLLIFPLATAKRFFNARRINATARIEIQPAFCVYPP